MHTILFSVFNRLNCVNSGLCSYFNAAFLKCWLDGFDRGVKLVEFILCIIIMVLVLEVGTTLRLIVCIVSLGRILDLGAL